MNVHLYGLCAHAGLQTIWISAHFQMLTSGDFSFLGKRNITMDYWTVWKEMNNKN